MNYRWWYIIYWGLLAVIFIEVLSSRLGYFEASYFFSMTATTIGYGEITPQTVTEKILVMVTGWSLFLSLLIETIIYLLTRIPKMTLPAVLELLIVADSAARLKSFLKHRTDNKDVFIVWDGESDIDALEELRSTYGVNYKVIDSIYDPDLFRSSNVINKALVLTSGNLNDTANTHRAIGTVQAIEANYGACETIAEVPNMELNLKRVSQGDLFIDVIPPDLLVKVVENSSVYNAYKKMLSKV